MEKQSPFFPDALQGGEAGKVFEDTWAAHITSYGLTCALKVNRPEKKPRDFWYIVHIIAQKIILTRVTGDEQLS